MTDAATARGEARELSSRATLFYKFGLPLAPAAWAVGSAAFVLSSFGGSDPDARSFALLFSVVGGGVAIILGWLLGRIKKVRLIGDALEISNFRSSIRVPLHDVERVSGTRFSNPEQVFLELRVPSPVGTRIAFIPSLRWVRGFSPHPLVAELAARVEACRVAAPPAPIAPPQSGFGRLARNGALLGLALGALVAAGEYVLHSSEAYRSAVAVARASGALVAAIGEPMREGWLVDGSVHSRGASGAARLEFDLVGPRGKAHIHAESRKSNGVWSADVLTARLPGRSDGLDLLAAPAANDPRR